MTLLTSPEGQAFPEIPASNNELADFLFKSFFYSQGEKTTQANLLAYGQDFYGAALAQITTDDREEIRQRAARKALSWLEHGPHTDVSPSKSTLAMRIARQIEKYEAQFTVTVPPKEAAPSEERDALTCVKMIDSDNLWVSYEGRFERKRGSGREYQDPFLSHVIFYGLLGRDAHNPAMNYIFRRVKHALLGQVLDSSGVSFKPDSGGEDPVIQFREVLAIYLEHHPDEQEEVQQALGQGQAAQF